MGRMVRTGRRDFAALQRAYWRGADDAHFAWQTGAPYIADEEAALLDGVAVRPGGRLLEIGCGEGANLHHLARRLSGVRFVGVDFTLAKARFAAVHAGAPAVCADAGALPFADGTFDAVLVRDLLHHLPAHARQGALVEAARVLAPGGRLTLIEPNGRHPLIAALALGVAAERGLFASTVERAAAEVRTAGLSVEAVERRQPLPLSRVLLHHRLGIPSLGALRGVP